MNREGSSDRAPAAWRQRLRALAHRHLRQDRRLVLSACTVLACAAALLLIPAPAESSDSSTRIDLAVPPAPTTFAATAVPTTPWQTVTVRAGQTLSQIFSSLDLGYATLNQVIADPDNAATLRTLHPGDELDFRIAADGTLEAMRFDRDAATRVVLSLTGDTVSEKLVTRDMERHVHVGQGTISSSLFAAGAEAGLDEAMVIKLADVFKYDIDFIKDIRKGDHFSVIYDDVWRDGERLYPGRIIAAEFFNRGKRFTAYRFELADGSINYYDEDGRPLQRALMRTPVKFTRISSRFTSKRKHPILGYTRAHEGVDYAAPTGTPIHAAGSGRIVYRGRARGYGNFIVIKHNKTYSTAYGHMSRFAKGERVGSWVDQGQVIGYVGMTGLATGPHLHYEVRVHGSQVNPLTMTMPKPKPLPEALLADFKASITPQLAQLQILDSNRRVLLASNTDSRSASPAGSD